MAYYTKKTREHKGKSLIKNLDDYVVVDIETTSLDDLNGEILEVSAIKIKDKQEIGQFSEIIKINNEVGFFTTRLTGITNEMVKKEGKELVDVLKSFREFIGDNVIVGHNVNFDINFLYDSMVENLGEYLSNDFVDTLRLSRKALPQLKHHKLDDLIDYYGLIKRDEHRALNDCVLTNQVYLNLAKCISVK